MSAAAVGPNPDVALDLVGADGTVVEGEAYEPAPADPLAGSSAGSWVGSAGSWRPSAADQWPAPGYRPESGGSPAHLGRGVTQP